MSVSRSIESESIVLIENKLGRLSHLLNTDRSGQFPFVWNGADYLLLNPLSFHILIK